MIKIKINGFVDKEISTEEEAIEKAIEKVEKIDKVASYGDNVLTKLYFIAPKAGVIVVAISEDDKEILKVDSQVLAVTQISEYPLTKLPNQLLVYKEVIANKQSTFSFDDLMNVAQAITDNSDEKVMPKQITVTKVIDYRNDDPSTLVLNSAFGDNIFLSTDAVISNDGDADAGSDALGQYIRIEPVRSENERYIYDGLSSGNTYKLKFTLSGDVCTDASNKHLLAIGDASDNYIYTIAYFNSAEDIRLNSNANINVVSCKINGEDMVDKVSKYEDVIKDRNEVEVVFELKGENGTKLFINNCCDNHTYRAMTSSSLQNVLIKTI